MKVETTRREAVEAQMLSEMRKGNEQFAESLKNTQTFQADFLNILRKAFANGN